MGRWVKRNQGEGWESGQVDKSENNLMGKFDRTRNIFPFKGPRWAGFSVVLETVQPHRLWQRSCLELNTHDQLAIT
jgi:hypothetical protein